MNGYIRRHLWTLSCCCLLLALAGQAAHAEPIRAFSDMQTFFDAVEIVSVETFEEFPSDSDIGIGSLTLDDVVYTSSERSAIWRATDSFITPSPPNSLITRNVVAPITLTFDAIEGRGTAAAIGFFFLPANDLPDAVYRFDVLAVDGKRFAETIAPLGADIFRGFSSESGISSLTIWPVNTNGTSNFALDNVSRGPVTPIPVPEPSTLVLVGSAILAGVTTRFTRGRFSVECRRRYRPSATSGT